MSYLEGGIKKVMMVIYIAQHARHHQYDDTDHPFATKHANQLKTC